MDTRLILEGKATVEDLEELHRLGYEFTINNGRITSVMVNGREEKGNE